MSKQEMDAVIQLLNANQADGDPSVEEQRAGMEALAGSFPLPEGAQQRAETIAGVPCEWQSVEGAKDDAVLLYFHGGGYVIGSVNTHRGLVSGFSGATGITGLSVDYRLAPEHPFPAAVEDAVAVYHALLEQGRDPAKIAIGGDSAGGGLSLALLLAARERGLPQPACAALLSPWSDLRIVAKAYESRKESDPMVRKDGISAMAAHYLGDTDPSNPLASPILADLAGLAPMIIHVGDREVLLDDSVDLAARAEEAGVDVTLKVWPDMIHVFQAFYPMVEEARQSIAEMGAFIAEKTA
ncbi:alpha/beta hydrolase [Parasphingopyxis sp. CP4]|uniref:alpha/beta hydrolase n=1 Tax=Parasphingopyxis sp. CP4 TaxID=2724527 RepID=UPI0015A390BD|nr:alpha/beta hydrolase [Parasphingopyxis sp. CP4]QLC22735.1 alpha/beta hydrolase [Parasphingopyxis sp. CP4]